jgi:putative spermidine/putrescine transport system substrate-binding protein
LIALVAATLFGPAVHAADLTVGAFGGIWEQSLRKCIIDPFTKQTGKTVDVVLGSPTQWLNQIAASPGKPPLDIVYNPTETAYEAIDRGLVQKFTPETVPNAQDVLPQFQKMTDGGWGSVHNYGAMGIIYNTETVKDPPKSFKDFVAGTIAGKWKASMPSVNYPSGGLTVSVWSFAKLYGGDVNNVTPGLDMVKKMQQSGNLSFWTDPNSVLNGLKSGDIDMALYWDGRAYAFIDDGNKDFKYYSPEPGVVVAFTWIQVVKNAAPAAMQFANFALAAAQQSCFGSAVRYGVANKDAVIAPAVAHEITPADVLIIPPYKEIVPKQGAWIEAWNKQIGR